MYVTGVRSLLRRIETRLYGCFRDSRAGEVAGVAPVPWDRSDLLTHHYCLLITYRQTGTPVATPVWFAPGEDELFIRSGATDGKIKRIRRHPGVLVAPCTFRGRPLGPPVRAEARILGTADAARAEQALQRRFGLRRRIYRALRDPTLDVVYLAVRPLDPNQEASSDFSTARASR